MTRWDAVVAGGLFGLLVFLLGAGDLLGEWWRRLLCVAMDLPFGERWARWVDRVAVWTTDDEW